MLSVYWFFAILPMDYYQDQQGCTAIWPDAEHQVSVIDTMLFSILINRTRTGWAYPSAGYLRSLFFFPLTPKIVFTPVPLMYIHSSTSFHFAAIKVAQRHCLTAPLLLFAQRIQTSCERIKFCLTFAAFPVSRNPFVVGCIAFPWTSSKWSHILQILPRQPLNRWRKRTLKQESKAIKFFNVLTGIHKDAQFHLDRSFQKRRDL